jgi:hypothetical protein
VPPPIFVVVVGPAGSVCVRTDWLLLTCISAYFEARWSRPLRVTSTPSGFNSRDKLVCLARRIAELGEKASGVDLQRCPLSIRSHDSRRLAARITLDHRAVAITVRDGGQEPAVVMREA